MKTSMFFLFVLIFPHKSISCNATAEDTLTMHLLLIDYGQLVRNRIRKKFMKNDVISRVILQRIRLLLRDFWSFP